MKTDEQITDQINQLKDALVYSNGTDIILLQGELRALNWVLADENETETTEE